MLRLALTRLATLVPMMFIVSSVVFFLVHLIPGDPARIMSGTQRVSQTQLENIRRQYRLDRPIYVQYGYWVSDLVQGDLGRSFRQRQDVRQMILNRLPITLKLASYSFALSLLIAVPLGIIAAVKRGSWIDVGATLFALVGVASLSRIAEALGMTVQELAAVWHSLPLDDLTIAARLGVSRQQVINARKSARLRLARRMMR